MMNRRVIRCGLVNNLYQICSLKIVLVSKAFISSLLRQFIIPVCLNDLLKYFWLSHNWTSVYYDGPLWSLDWLSHLIGPLHVHCAGHVAPALRSIVNLIKQAFTQVYYWVLQLELSLFWGSFRDTIEFKGMNIIFSVTDLQAKSPCS